MNAVHPIDSCWQTLFKDIFSSTHFSYSHTLQALQWSKRQLPLEKYCLFDVFLDNKKCITSSQDGILHVNPRSRTFRRCRRCTFPSRTYKSSMITLAWCWNQACKLFWRWLSFFQIHEYNSAWLSDLLSELAGLGQL